MTETRSVKRQARKRQARLKHRRSLAAGQRVPPALAVGFTLGERAALHIIADECRAHGDCAMTIDGLAARAGIGRTTVNRVLRKAREDGLITLERRWRTSMAAMNKSLARTNKSHARAEATNQQVLSHNRGCPRSPAGRARHQPFVNPAAIRSRACTRRKPLRRRRCANCSTTPTATIGTSSSLRIAR